jgi:hypothetical protein
MQPKCRRNVDEIVFLKFFIFFFAFGWFGLVRTLPIFLLASHWPSSSSLLFALLHFFALFHFYLLASLRKDEWLKLNIEKVEKVNILTSLNHGETVLSVFCNLIHQLVSYSPQPLLLI